MFETRISQNLVTIHVPPHDTNAHRAAIQLLNAMAEATRAGRRILASPDRCAAAAADQAESGSRLP